MSKRITITLSDDLAEAAEILRKRRRYRTPSEYFAGLARYDGQSQRDHLLTAEWAALTGYERDRLDSAILRQVQTGEGVKGSWLEARIDAAVKRHLEGGHVPSAHQIATEIARDIMKDADLVRRSSDA